MGKSKSSSETQEFNQDKYNKGLTEQYNAINNMEEGEIEVSNDTREEILKKIQSEIGTEKQGEQNVTGSLILESENQAAGQPLIEAAYQQNKNLDSYFVYHEGSLEDYYYAFQNNLINEKELNIYLKNDPYIQKLGITSKEQLEEYIKNNGEITIVANSEEIGNTSPNDKNDILNYDPNTQYISSDGTLINYNSDEATGFAERLNTLGIDIEIIIRKIASIAGSITLNPETLGKLGGDVSGLFDEIKNGIQNILNIVIGLHKEAKTLITNVEGVDETSIEDLLGEEEEEQPKDTDEDPTDNTRNPSNHSHDDSDDDEAFQVITPVEETPQIENADLIAASIGSLVFTTAINLYEVIGGTAIQSDANTQYGLLGVEKVNDVFYYKLIDKTTGKIYYATSSDVPMEVEALHTKEESMLLNSTDIGSEDNFEKLADVDKYFIVTEKQELNGIEFAAVLDSNDGKTYYVPFSNSTEYVMVNSVQNVEEGGE